MPHVADGWSITLVKQAPEILFPTAIVTAPDGTVYLGQDPMDMPGPPTKPSDSVVAIKDGKVRVFADKLWAVMGLEWAEDTLYVVHAPFLSAFRDTNGDGKSDQRVDLITGLGPKIPGFSGINDHIASGVRLGMDGFLYVSVGDKGIPKGVGKDGATIQLFGGGVIRVRTDGTGLEVVSTGERNPLSVALSAHDDIFTYGNDDDSKKWPNSLTHHIVGGHFGYPYQFLTNPSRALPIMHGQLGGSGAQGICYNEDGLPASYRGNLFFCDWGLQTVFRYTIEKDGGTFRLKTRTPFVTKGGVDDFRPFSLCVADDPSSLYLVDWAYTGWLANGPKTGRLYRLSYTGPDKPAQTPRKDAIQDLDHPALRVRLAAQRKIQREGKSAALQDRLRVRAPEPGRLHALWALSQSDASPSARQAIRALMEDASPSIRAQAARSCGIQRDLAAIPLIAAMLKDKDAVVRREAAIALGKMGDSSGAAPLVAALGDPDIFVSWSIRHALRALKAWDVDALTAALLDPKRSDDALKLCDETWSWAVAAALGGATAKTADPERRAAFVGTLAGLYFHYPEWSGAWFGTNPLAGQFPKKTVAWDTTPMMRIKRLLIFTLLNDPSPQVRARAIAGFFAIGAAGAGVLREVLPKEKDERNRAAIAEALGVLGDFASAGPLGALAIDPNQPESVRIAALDALGRLRGPEALRARLSLVYDEKAPASLVARALPALGREGIIPLNDLAGFLDHADPVVRAAALRALAPSKGRSVPGEIRESVLAKLNDPNVGVRAAAIEAVVTLDLREAVPRLIALGLGATDATHEAASWGLAAMPEAQALPVYLAMLRDRSQETRRRGEQAILVLRDAPGVRRDLERSARSGTFDGPSALALERVLTRFTPVKNWKVIGPFARTTAQVFLGEPSIDFTRRHSGVEGREIAWTERNSTSPDGRIVLDDFKSGAGDRGGFGYDANGSPDLASFAYAEVDSIADRDALLIAGSSGSLIVTLNELVVINDSSIAGRAYLPDSDVIPVALRKGKNRLLVRTRQGIGSWSFSVQVSEPSSVTVARKGPRAESAEALRAFAMAREGDPKSGESLFFNAKGIGCGKCHAANGTGSANFGPDLTGIALKYDKAEIIRSVLDPSNRIATGYQPALIATKDGRVINGLVRAETDAYVELSDKDAKLIRVSKPEIEERKAGEVSVMPGGLAASLTRVEFADLISYLASLKAPARP